MQGKIIYISAKSQGFTPETTALKKEQTRRIQDGAVKKINPSSSEFGSFVCIKLHLINIE